MFEVGKLTDESLDSFLGELEKVGFVEAEEKSIHEATRSHISLSVLNKRRCCVRQSSQLNYDISALFDGICLRLADCLPNL